MAVVRSSPSTLKKLVDVIPPHFSLLPQCGPSNIPEFPSINQLHLSDKKCHSTCLPSSNWPNIALGVTLVHDGRDPHFTVQWSALLMSVSICSMLFLHHLSITTLTQSGEAGGLGLICFEEEDPKKNVQTQGIGVQNYTRDAVKYFCSGKDLTTSGKDFHGLNSILSVCRSVKCELILS